MSNYIPLEKCVHGGLYLLKSRNLSLGIYNKPTQGFIGIRTKFYDRFLFTEHHYDLGAEVAVPEFKSEKEVYDDKHW